MSRAESEHSSRVADAVRASRRAAVLTVVGFASLLGAFGYSAYRLATYDQIIEARKQELTRLESRADELSRQRDDLKGEIATQRRELDRLLSQQEIAKAKIAQGEPEVAEKILELPPVGASGSRTPRIFVHVRSRDQKTLAAHITERLEQAGFRVPGTEILVDKGPSRNELRYFRVEDEAEAREILGVLEQGFPGNGWGMNRVQGYEDSIRPLHFELWLAPSS